MQTATETLRDVTERTLSDVGEGIAAAVPRLVTALIVFAIAYAAIRIALAVLGRSLRRVYPDDQVLIARLWVTVVGVFLWFGAGLVLLKIAGMGDLATSLGTATGFLALGVSYALSDMIEDAVAGVYLLRDPDFNPGDRVTAASFTGTVRSIELRKSRLELDDGDTVVLANRDVEAKWTKESSAGDSTTTTG